MTKGYAIFKAYLSDESGATAIEYGLIVGLIGMGIITGMRAFGSSSDGAWQKLSNAVQNGVS
ncbi:MAG: Flp family type IVb pilin [Hellea sp.]|nr:Flp family type IVb pilin [Hellea sp.]